jgi:hypothetical protein
MLARGKGCAAHPDAECRSNYYGGCHAEWFKNEVKVDCTAAAAADKKSLGGNLFKPCIQINCFVDPCATARSCERYPGAVCKSNYCGGCHAEYYYNGARVYC